MPKPQLYPIKKLLRLDTETMEAIKKFQKEQLGNPSESEAIRRLLKDKLIGIGLMKPTE